MKYIFILFIFAAGFFVLKNNSLITHPIISGTPPYDTSDTTVPENYENTIYRHWTRPHGPPKVALQVGHWKTHELPDELARLRSNTGSSGGGKAEWEVNYEIAQKTKQILEKKGIVVELLPATIPPSYWADIFIAIHADGSLNQNMSGYKAATPRRDYTGKAEKLLQYVENAYEKATGLIKDPMSPEI